MSTTLRGTSTSRAVHSAAYLACVPSTPATHTTHAKSYAAKFWATKNFAAYGLRGTWSSIR